MKQMPRTTSAQAGSRVSLLALDKLEFLHLLNHSKTSEMQREIEANNEKEDEAVKMKIEALSGNVNKTNTVVAPSKMKMLNAPHLIFDPVSDHLKNVALAKLE